MKPEGVDKLFSAQRLSLQGRPREEALENIRLVFQEWRAYEAKESKHARGLPVVPSC